MHIEPFIALTDPLRRQNAETIVRTCVHCGFCNAACPTYQLLGDERDGPRGRIYLIKHVLEGAAATAKTRQHLDRCLTCRACEAACPSGVAYGDLVDVGRAVVERQAPRPWRDALKRRLLAQVMPYPKRFAWALCSARLLKPLLPKLWRRKLPAKPAAQPFEPLARHERKILLLNGCVQSVLAPEIDQALERILARFGIGAVRAEAAGCCGALSYHLNFQERGLNFMRRNIDAWLPFLDNGVDAIVATASGCGVTLKDYARLLKHDADYGLKAERVADASVDAVELLEKQDWTNVRPSLRPSLDRKIAFQSPCTLQHGQKLSGRVEALLNRLGFQLTAVPNGHVCCGSAGTYSLLQPELAERLQQNKLSALLSGRPDEIVTANIGCLLHLRPDAAVPVRHWLEAVAEALA